MAMKRQGHDRCEKPSGSELDCQRPGVLAVLESQTHSLQCVLDFPSDPWPWARWRSFEAEASVCGLVLGPYMARTIGRMAANWGWRAHRASKELWIGFYHMRLSHPKVKPSSQESGTITLCQPSAQLHYFGRPGKPGLDRCRQSATSDCGTGKTVNPATSCGHANISKTTTQHRAVVALGQ
ncbi:hypothetical protein CORC01_14047 [Colletotrichum orchidophilum]|uniref:Uncharacterized protein n=1 Tax=Colletotrichum orchidophilum TaxID=1209926 RepID=A0A1G4AN84_9PEZI|nr:uncharacterized protein CORC01_14047 [Colletotrichum orchidophilum]OHE90658.1 hypothetical protein CORC01_14047 [Colletotrichum orchidophilum]